MTSLLTRIIIKACELPRSEYPWEDAIWHSGQEKRRPPEWNFIAVGTGAYQRAKDGEVIFTNDEGVEMILGRPVAVDTSLEADSFKLLP